MLGQHKYIFQYKDYLQKKNERTGGKGDLGTRKRQGKLESKTDAEMGKEHRIGEMEMKLLLEGQGCFPVLCFPLFDLCCTLSSITEGESNNLVFLIHFLIFGFLQKNMRCRGAQSLGQNMKGISKSQNTIKLTFLYGAWISDPSSRPGGVPQ